MADNVHADCMCGDPECRVWLEHGYAPPAYQHRSDCAVHNEPASPAGPCDCRGITIVIGKAL